MTALATLLARRIALTGPIPVAAFMAEALGHPEHGYYRKHDPLGADGDFTTAPEISQMFGELIGLWCAEMWRLMGAPDPVRLVELGPGRGTLMADALRASKVLPGFHEAIHVDLVETSPALRDAQRKTIHHDRIDWHDELGSVPEGPFLLIANEYFDALPIHQLVRAETGWRERLIGHDGERFRFVLGGPAAHAALLAPSVAAAPIGAIAELCPLGLRHAHDIAHRIERDGGAALIIDYGHTASAAGETLQAVRRHEHADPLTDPGEADLTAHVDFAALVRGAAGHASIHGPTRQGDFLRALGIERRAEQLAAHATPQQARDIESARQRLIGESEMGSLFKVLCLTHPALAAPPGFSETSEDA